MTAPEGVVVGYDGSAASQRALSWAARAARDRQVRLTVCHAQEVPADLPPDPALEEAIRAGLRQQGSAVLARGARLARDAMGSGIVEPVLADGRAAAVLCEHSARAEMVVLGACGSDGGVHGLLLGSVAAQVAGYAPGTVVIERGHWRPAGGYRPGPVVAGADGSPGSLAALRFAADEAARRDVPLLAVCSLAGAGGPVAGERRITEDVKDALLHLEKTHAGLTVLNEVTSTGPLAALLAAARDAQLVAIGRRGLGGVTGMRLGSAGQGLLSHSPCPVAIVAMRDEVPEGMAADLPGGRG